MAGTFNLRVTLTGLMVSILNADDTSNARMCTLLVDGRAPVKGLDETDLAPHRGFIRFPLDTVVPLPPGAEEHVGVWYLKRQRLIFQVTEEPMPEGNSPNRFRVDELALREDEPHPEQAAEGQEGSFTWVLDMSQVFPRFDLDPRLLDPAPPKDSVLAQVVFDRGRVRTQKLTNVVWDYDDTLSGRPFRQQFAHEVVVMMDRLRTAEIRVVDFDDPDNPEKNQTVDLSRFQKDGTVNITIVNVCDRNPLQWPIPITVTPDVDSKWYFQLMPEDLKTEVRNTLGRAELPIPRPVPDSEGVGAPGSGNCIKSRFRSLRYRIRELDR